MELISLDAKFLLFNPPISVLPYNYTSIKFETKEVREKIYNFINKYAHGDNLTFFNKNKLYFKDLQLENTSVSSSVVD